MDVKLRSIFVTILIVLSVFPLKSPITIAQESTSQIDYGPYQVGWTILTNISQTSGKQLRVKLFYPANESAKDAEPIVTDAPYPTLIFIPGYGNSLEQATSMAKMICSHGFCFVSVGSLQGAWEFERSMDQRFAFDWIRDHNENSSFVLNNMFDITNIGAIGFSCGGRGSLVSALNSSDFKVLIIVDTGLDLNYCERVANINDVSIPVLIFAGTRGRFGDLDLVYENCNSPKFLVVTDDTHNSIMGNSIIFKYVSVFCKVYLSGDEEYIPYLYGEYAQQDVGEELVEIRYDVSEGRTNYSTDSVVIEPDSVHVGDNMTFTVKVRNSGTKTGKHYLAFELDNEYGDEYWDQASVSLDPNVPETIVFDYLPTQVGYHNFTVGGILGEFNVMEKVEKTTEIEEPKPEQETNNWIPGFPAMSIIAALVIYALLREWLM